MEMKTTANLQEEILLKSDSEYGEEKNATTTSKRLIVPFYKSRFNA